MEKKMENEREIGFIWGFIGFLVFRAYPKAPRTIWGLLGEGMGFGGYGLGSHYEGPRALG